MDAPVDLTNLRTITDGDVEMEKELFREFLESSKESLNRLEVNLDKNADAWRTGAHALKGNALNIGAYKLSELCKKAQDAYLASKEEKAGILKCINDEYQMVHDYLQTQ